MKIEKFLPFIAVMGATGLGISLYLLSDYSEPLLKLFGEVLNSL